MLRPLRASLTVSGVVWCLRDPFQPSSRCVSAQTSSSIRRSRGGRPGDDKRFRWLSKQVFTDRHDGELGYPLQGVRGRWQPWRLMPVSHRRARYILTVMAEHHPNGRWSTLFFSLPSYALHSSSFRTAARCHAASSYHRWQRVQLLAA